VAPKIRERLKTAVDQLRAAGHTDSAEAVETILEPGGWSQLRLPEGSFTTNVPLTVRESLRDALKDAAESQSKTLSGLVTKGYREVLAGSWTPPERPGRTTPAPGDGAVVLNVTVEDEVRRELREWIRTEAPKLGYRLKMTEAWVAISYLRSQLGVTDEVLASYVERLAK
jgi:hypothetical protein